jgi:hypothetical protein
MALFQPIAGNLSGSVAGNTYSHNKGGRYVRVRAVPVNPSTPRQTAVRTQMSTNSRAWNGLTVGQRAAWSAYAISNPTINRLGVPVRSAGISIFNKINNVSRDSGNGQISNPPAGVGPASLTSIGTLSNAGAVMTIPFTVTPIGANLRIAVRWTLPGRASQNPNYRAARLIGYSAVNAASPLVITLPAVPTTGQTTNFFLSVVDASGRETPLLQSRYTFT